MAREQDWPVPPTQGQPAGSNEAAGGRGEDIALARGCIFAIVAVTIAAGLLAFAAGVMLRAVQP